MKEKKLSQLLDIYEAMDLVKEIHRSEHFNSYFNEVKKQINTMLP
jgi:hypothetical protein